MKDWAQELDANDSITNDSLDEQLSIKEYVEDIMGIDWDDFSESNNPELMQRVMTEYNAYLSREDRDFAAAIADDLDTDDFLENVPDEEISDIDETVVDDLDSDNTIESDDETHFEENSNDVIVDDLDSDNTIMAASEVEPDRIDNDIAEDSLDLDDTSNTESFAETVVSAATMHPNDVGVKMYANIVQSKIDEIENTDYSLNLIEKIKIKAKDFTTKIIVNIINLIKIQIIIFINWLGEIL